PQACQQFRRLIRSEILEELGIVATRSAVAHPDAEVGKARGTVKFRANEPAASAEEVLPRSEREPVRVAGITSVIYLPRLNPVQAATRELQRLERLRVDRPNEVLELPLPTDTGLTEEQWVA